MITKTRRQQESIEIVKEKDYTGILNLCIRFGKTRVGLLIYKEFVNTYKKTAVILVPSQTIREVWIKEDRFVSAASPIVVTANQILSLNSKIYTNLLIVDECHKFTSDEWYKLINSELIVYNRIVLLTGSIPIGDRLAKLLKVAPIIDTVTEQEALENNWISNYVEYNVPLELSNDDKIRYANYTEVLSAVFYKYKDLNKHILQDGNIVFKDDLDLIYAAATGKHSREYGFISSETVRQAIINRMRAGVEDENWNHTIISNETNKCVEAVTNRNCLLTANTVKLEAALHIINTLSLPTMCFNESIGFSDRLVDEINAIYGEVAISYHSKTVSKPLINPETKEYYMYVGGEKANTPKMFSKKKQLEYAIEAIRHNMYKVISTVKALDEGITIPEIECIITTSGSANPIQYDQRTGRGKTLVDSNKVTKIYNLYFEDFVYNDKQYKSRDKEKLIIRQRNNAQVKQINLLDI